MKSILVTGANSGIGLALCKALCRDHGCKVFLGSRNPERGRIAIEAVKEHVNDTDAVNNVELVVIDVGSNESVKAAAKSLHDKNVRLNAIVNNAGTMSSPPKDIVNVNIKGPKRVVDHFMPLLESAGSRIVNIGSGSGPDYVASRKNDVEVQRLLCSPDITWEQIEKLMADEIPHDPYEGYGISKALLSSYTMLLAKEYPQILSLCLSPGYIDTPLTAKYPGGKPPEEGIKPILHCLFSDIPKQANGWYFGSDSKRSPLHFMRNPGEPEFDGTYPWN